MNNTSFADYVAQQGYILIADLGEVIHNIQKERANNVVLEYTYPYRSCAGETMSCPVIEVTDNEKSYCIACGNRHTLIGIDTSDGEYSPDVFCLRCLEDAICKARAIFAKKTEA